MWPHRQTSPPTTLPCQNCVSPQPHSKAAMHTHTPYAMIQTFNQFSKLPHINYMTA
jgi:hypothetical protein